MAPKIQRPRTAYILFAAEERDTLTREFPDSGFAEIAKRISERWQSLADDQKAVWQAKADEEKCDFGRGRSLAFL